MRLQILVARWLYGCSRGRKEYLIADWTRQCRFTQKRETLILSDVIISAHRSRALGESYSHHFHVRHSAIQRSPNSWAGTFSFVRMS